MTENGYGKHHERETKSYARANASHNTVYAVRFAHPNCSAPVGRFATSHTPGTLATRTYRKKVRNMNERYKILKEDCLKWFDSYSDENIHLTFIDPPFRQLLRIILSSTLSGDTVLDPFAGTGTTLVVAHQLKRNSIGIEIDSEYVKIIKDRLNHLKPADDIMKYYDYYRHTPDLRDIWSVEKTLLIAEQRRLF
jgi:16S rRNA G966 N2-methylase RsmD